MASVYDRSGRQVGEVTRSGMVYDVNQRRVGQVIGVDSVSTGGDLEDASGRHVGHVVGMNSVSVTADIYDRHDNYVGKVVGLRSVADNCSIENRNGDDVGEVSTTHASAVGAALLLLPLVPGVAQKTLAVGRDAGGSVAARPDPGRFRPRAEYEPEPRSHKQTRRRRLSYVVLVLVLLTGVGIFIGMRLSGGSSRLSLGGVSVTIPAGWHNLNLAASQNAAAAAPSLSPPCPHSLFGGPPACQDALTLLSAPGANVEQALHRISQVRFTAIQKDIVHVTVIRGQTMTAGGCPAYMREWHVTWTSPPDTLEEGIAIRTGVVYANTHIIYVFIRFADQAGASPQPMIKTIASSIQCNK